MNSHNFDHKNVIKYKIDLVFLARLTKILHCIFDHRNKFASISFIILLTTLLIEQLLIYHVGIIPSSYYKVLSEKNEVDFFRLTLQSLGLLASMSLIKSGRSYLVSSLYGFWRYALCDYCHGLYFSNLKFYNLNIFYQNIDNPDQRMTQDIDKFCNLLSRLLETISTLPFVIVYYSWQTYLNIGWIGPVGCFTFFLLATIINKFFMAPIVPLIVKQENKEGDFRYKHMQIRHNAENIAFSEAFIIEPQHTNRKLNFLLNVQQNIFNRQFILNIGINSCDYSGSILSYLLLAIPIFSNKYDHLLPSDVSALVSKNAFVCIYLISAFTILVDQFGKVADMAGFVHRIGELLEYLESSDDKMSSKLDELAANPQKSQDILVEINKTELSSPDNKKQFFSELSLIVEKNKHILITGPSSSGKTSFLRMLVGLWKPKSGYVKKYCKPGSSGILCIPQRLYFFQGSLLELITYPLNCINNQLINENYILSLLKKVGLEDLIMRVNGFYSVPTAQWQDILSPGEMQILSFVRLFYHHPQLAILDEATSSVSESVEEILYQECNVLGITYISVGHRNSLKKFHSIILCLSNSTFEILKS